MTKNSNHIKGEKELIWVEKDFALKYEELASDSSLNQQRMQALDDYITTIQETSRMEFRANLEGLEEDVAIYTGLMLKVKEAFKKAKNEQLEASYALWEGFEKEIPYIENKIDSIVKTLKPLEEKVNNLDKLWGKVNTWNIERMVKAIDAISELYGKNEKMVKFLVNNFKEESK